VGAYVLDCDGQVIVTEVALGLAFGGLFDIIEGFGVVRWGFVELELSGYGTSRDVGGVVSGYGLEGGGGGCGLCCCRHCGFTVAVQCGWCKLEVN